MDTLGLYIIDAERREISKLEILRDSIRKLVHPALILYTVCKENNMNNVVALFQHPSRFLGLPPRSLYLMRLSEDHVSVIRVLVDHVLPSNILGIVFKDGTCCDIYVDSRGVRFDSEGGEYLKILSVENGVAGSNIFRISCEDFPRFSIYLKRDEIGLLEVDHSNIFIRKVSLLHKYSPILGPDAPVGRSGIVSLVARLKGLELKDDVGKFLEAFSERRGGCVKCVSRCLNFVDNSPLLYDYIRNIYELCIDDDLLNKLLSVCDDPIFILQCLYMYRFSYPERLAKGFEKKAVLLYYSSNILDLCPLSLLLYSKSRNFELDIPIQVLWYIYRRALDPDRLVKIAETLRPCFRSILRREALEEASKVLLSVDDVPNDVRYVEPVSNLRGRKVQLALDLVTSVEEIIDIAFTCASAGIDIVEIGTPLLKYYGVKIVEQVKANLPEGIIVFADTKTMDVGDLEARLAYRAGADMMSVMAIGTLLKVKEALFEAMKFDKIVLVDLMQLSDPVQTILDMEEIVEDAYPWLVICLHRGITEQLRGRGIESDVDLIRKVREIVKGRCPIAVAGGVRPGTARRLVEAGADIVIVGAALYTSRNIENTAKNLVKEVKE